MLPGLAGDGAMSRAGDLYTIFGRALDKPLVRRAIFLDAACGSRDALRARVERLLALADRRDGFLDRTPIVAAGSNAGDDGRAKRAQVGGYRLLHRLGASGTAEVWLAERRGRAGPQRAALKILRDRACAAHERGILASLDHPGIARLHGSGIAVDGSAYLVIEYVEGEDVIAHCKARGLGVESKLALFSRICDAVACVHAQRIVHRDLKPANILVAADGRVKLIDFGIAKALGARRDREGARRLRLSPAYAAPEQLAGREAGLTADVYALGVILFELLTGELPWRRDASPLATAVNRLFATRAPPPSRVALRDSRAARGAIDRELDAIVAIALRREPAARYADAGALAAAIRRRAERPAARADRERVR
jgi:serine/threonine protein kinase